MDVKSVPSCLFSETYCGGYCGEDPPLPIPNREVKLTIADGTAIPGGRVGSRHFLIRSPRHQTMSGTFCICKSGGRSLLRSGFQSLVSLSGVVRNLLTDSVLSVSPAWHGRQAKPVKSL